MNEFLRGKRNADKQALRLYARDGSMGRPSPRLESPWKKTKTRGGSKEARRMNERWVAAAEEAYAAMPTPPRDESHDDRSTMGGQVERFLSKRGVQFS